MLNERIDKLNEFLAANPGDPFLQHALALEFIKEGNDHQARKLFENILVNDPLYIGSYYHLGKLLERQGEAALAIECYQKGMQAARQAGDNHALNELRAAHEDISE